VNIILCNNCGKIMSRYTIKCTTCSGTNLETFKDANSPRLKEKLRTITGVQEAAHPFASAVLVLLLAMTVSLCAYYAKGHAPAKTASISTDSNWH
jgi:hypothetical protein